MLKQLSPIGASQYEFFKSNSTTGFDASYEFDPLGVEIPNSGAHLRPGGHSGDMSGATGGSSDSRFGAIENPAAGCVGTIMLDGLPTPCDLVRNMGALQLKQGDKKYDLLMFGDSHVWVDAWEEYYIDGKGYLGTDKNGNEIYDAGTTGIRNVGYFITIAGGGPPLGTLNLRPLIQGQRPADTTATEKLLTKDCLDFLNRILAQLKNPYSTNLLDVLKKAKEFPLYTTHLTTEEKKKRLGGTHKSVTNPDFYIELDEDSYAKDPYILIHELFHGADTSGEGYSHYDMAKAAVAAAEADPAFMKYAKRHGGLKTPKTPDYSSDPLDYYNADVFDSIARHGCTKPIDCN